MPGILEKIKDIELEIERTQKNKATNSHLCLLRGKLAKYRAQLLDDNCKGAGGGPEGFDVMKSGDARVAMIGFPSVGKSSMLSRMTKTQSSVAAYEFTTLTCIPGVLEYQDAKIQLLDLPGIIEGASKGKGRGKQVIGVARTADLVLMMLDASKADIQRELLSYELESVGIRINKKPPDIYFKVRSGGGIKFNTTVELTHVNEDLVRKLLQMYKIHNAEVLFREDATSDDFVDVIQGTCKYLKCLFVVNKVDTIGLDEVDRLAHLPHHVVTSIHLSLNLDYLLEKLWEYLDFIRVFTKKRGKRPDFSEPLILRNGSTVEHVCHSIHRSFAQRLKYALVWGTSAKHQPQRVGISHTMEDEDVIQLMARA